MDREEIRLLASGHYLQTNRTKTVKIEDIDNFVNGALFYFDLLQKKSIKDKSPENKDHKTVSQTI
jgi:hypothetical protein